MSDTLARRFTARAAALQHKAYDRDFIRELDELLSSPNFEERNAERDWRKFVDTELRSIWPHLDKAMRLAIYLTALGAELGSC